VADAGTSDVVDSVVGEDVGLGLGAAVVGLVDGVELVLLGDEEGAVLLDVGLGSPLGDEVGDEEADAEGDDVGVLDTAGAEPRIPLILFLNSSRRSVISVSV